MELTLHQHLPVNLEESILVEDYEIYISNEVADNVTIVDNNKKSSSYLHLPMFHKKTNAASLLLYHH